MFLRVDHLAFPSFDTAKTDRFYTAVMGFRLTFAVDGVSASWNGRRYLMTMYARGDTHMHFFHLRGMKRSRPDDLPPDIRHVALAVSSQRDLVAWKRRLKAHGVSYWVEDHAGAPSIYFSDPNDVMIEVTYQPPKKKHARAAAPARDVLKRWIAAPKIRSR